MHTRILSSALWCLVFSLRIQAGTLIPFDLHKEAKEAEAILHVLVTRTETFYINEDGSKAASLSEVPGIFSFRKLCRAEVVEVVNGEYDNNELQLDDFNKHLGDYRTDVSSGVGFDTDEEFILFVRALDGQAPEVEIRGIFRVFVLPGHPEKVAIYGASHLGGMSVEAFNQDRGYRAAYYLSDLKRRLGSLVLRSRDD